MTTSTKHPGHPSLLQGGNAGGWLDCRAALTPEATALVDQHGKVSYAELKQAQDDLRRQLAALGLRGHCSEDSDVADRIALLGPPSRNWVAAMHAVQSLGLILVPIGHRLTAEEVAFQLQDSGARAILYAEETAAIADSCEAQFKIPLQQNWGRVPFSKWGQTLFRKWYPSPIFSILYTSGTTGRPKGAVLSRLNHEAAARASARRLGHGEQDCWLGMMPLHHVGGLATLIRAVLDGGSVWLHHEFDPHLAAQLIADGEVTIASMVATMLARTLAEAPDVTASPRFRTLLLGGGPADPTLLANAIAHSLPLTNTYGMTEAASQIATQPPGAGLTWPQSCGSPLEGTDVRVDENGEIHVRGPNVFAGYWNQEEATAQSFQDGWFRTGDLGHFNENGELEIEARRSDLILSGGENVYPVEVENVLLAHPWVQEALVQGVADPLWGQRVEARVVLSPEALAELSEKDITVELEVWCRQDLAPYKIPKTLHFVESLPRTSSGKLRRSSNAPERSS